MKDKFDRFLLRRIDKASLFDVYSVNNVDTKGNKHEVASVLSVVVSFMPH